MEAIYSWVKNVVCCLIIITVTLNVLPDNQYKKYVRVFTSILLLIVIISPLNKFGDITSKINRLFQGFTVQTNVKDLKSNIEKEQESYLDENISIYKEEIITQLNKEMEKDKYVVKSLEFSNGTGEGFIGMDVVITKEDEIKNMINIDKILIGDEETYSQDKQALILKLKNFMKDFYNIGAGNINISIQR